MSPQNLHEQSAISDPVRRILNARLRKAQERLVDSIEVPCTVRVCPLHGLMVDTRVAASLADVLSRRVPIGRCW